MYILYVYHIYISVCVWTFAYIHMYIYICIYIYICNMYTEYYSCILILLHLSVSFSLTIGLPPFNATPSERNV